MLGEKAYSGTINRTYNINGCNRVGVTAIGIYLCRNGNGWL